MKIATVVGARPQFIKAAAFSRAARASGRIDEVLIHTGQHYDPAMSQVFFDELEIPAPDHDLAVGSGGHGAQTGRMLEALERLFLQLRPDRVLVYGDTNSTLAGGLAAAKLGIPVVHVEAGLRSYLPQQPEETNRVLTDHLSAMLLAPTARAVANLRREGLPAERIHEVGDVMYDVARYYGAKAARRSAVLETSGLRPRGYALATVHRAENTDDPRRLAAIFEALGRLAADLPVVVPLHPRTRKALGGVVSPRALAGIRLLEPVGYLDMVMLEQHARLVVTDSGGVQKEAFFHRVPCVTLREATEWGELVEAGWNRLAPVGDPAGILRTARAMLEAGPGADIRPYGDGRSAERMVALLAGDGPPSAEAKALEASTPRAA